jgi:Flp pilus assembly protein TadD
MSDTDDSAARLAAARERHRAGAIDEAAAVYQTVLQFEPDHPTALHLLAVANLQRGDPEGAVALLERARIAAPRDADVLNTLGEALRVLGRSVAAGDANRAGGGAAPRRPRRRPPPRPLRRVRRRRPSRTRARCCTA